MRNPRRLPQLSAPELAFVDGLVAAVVQSVLGEFRAGKMPGANTRLPKMRARASGQETRALAESQYEQAILHLPEYL